MICVSSTKMKVPWDQGWSLLITVSPAPSTILSLHNEYLIITFNCLLSVLNVHIQNWNADHPWKHCSTCRAAMLHSSKEEHPQRLCEWCPASSPVVSSMWTISLDGVLWVCALFFSTSVDGNSMSPMAQLKIFRSPFDSSFTLTPHFHSIRKFY